MDPTLLSLLDSIPQKPLRSKLETHHELIRPRSGTALSVGWPSTASSLCVIACT